MRLGNIIIDPFDERNLGTTSYDVTLGPWYYRERPPEGGMGLYNPYDEQHVRRVWGEEPHYAVEAREFTERTGVVLHGIAPTDRVIWIHPARPWDATFLRSVSVPAGVTSASRIVGRWR